MANVTAKKDRKAKKAAKAETELQELTAKAQRRGDKLARTLNRIVAHTALDSSHPIQALLKALDRGLAKLRQPDGAPEKPQSKAAKAKKPKADKAPATTTKKTPAKARKTARSSWIEKEEPTTPTETEAAAT